MPQRLSTSRSAAVSRRDPHKVYAAVEPHLIEESDTTSDTSSPPTAMTSGLIPMGSSRESNDRVGVRMDERNCSHAATAAGNLGTVGPGAEPPVAVASHAFAHKEPHPELLQDHLQKTKQETQAAPSSDPFPSGEGVGVLSPEGATEACQRFDMDDGAEPRPRCHNEKGADSAGSRPDSVNTNEGEADTLPDYFNLSDEYGPEGAPTGRNQPDDDDDDDVQQLGGSRFLGSPVGSSSGFKRDNRRVHQDRKSTGRYSRSSRHDNTSSSGPGPRYEEDDGRASASASDHSDCWPSSSRGRRNRQRKSRPQQQECFERCTRHTSRRPLLTAAKRNARVVPFEKLAAPGSTESEEARRRLPVSSRSSARYTSSPPRRHPQGSEDSTPQRRRRRGVSGNRSRGSRRLSLTETKSISEHMNHPLEEEMARLRRENEVLKKRQERPTRFNGDESEVRSWNGRYNADDHVTSREYSPPSSRRHDQAIHSSRHRDRHIGENGASRGQHRRRSRCHTRDTHPPDIDSSSVRSSSRRNRDGSSNPHPATWKWSDFVSKSNASPRSTGQASWGAGTSSENATAGGFDVSLPRVLVEGGFLWKIPFHNAGTPKRRWFQIKPANGLLTTASGRLVVRPVMAARDGGGSGGTEVDGWDEVGGAYSERNSDGGVGKDAGVYNIPMMPLRAAWPLVFIWVDPDRDLKRSPPREMGIEEIVDLARGHKTPAFWQQAAHRGIHTLPDPKLCFSLVGHDRTLDLAAETLSEAKEWVRALARVAVMMKRGGEAVAGDTTMAPDRSLLEPVGTTAYSGPEEVGADERVESGAKVISHKGSQRRKSDGAAAPPLHTEWSQRDVSARSEGGFVPKNTAPLGEGGAWSIDTIRAWRRRLFPAVTRGDIATVVSLFDQGCPVDLIQTGTGDTPMLLACRLGDIEMARECLRRGSRNDPHPDFGQTALQAAVASGQEACARLLLETAAPSRSDAVVSNHKDPNKETPLHVACRRGYCGIVEALLHHGADLRAVDRNGNTPLHGAGAGGHADALAALLDVGGDAVLEERNARGERALHAAAASGHIACVELLLGTAAEPDVPNEDGQTPFALASRGGHLAVTRLIRQYAPAAGTPSGGGAQFQAQRRGSVGAVSAKTDALPRPHGGGSTSNGPGTPDHGKSREAEHRRSFGAAGLDLQQFGVSAGGGESIPGRHPASMGAGSSDRVLLEGNGEHHSRSVHAREGDPHITEGAPPPVDDDHINCPPSLSSAPAHGSLFDGLQVYVVGGRQPLSSQRNTAPASATAAAGMASTTSGHAAAAARNMILDGQLYSTSSREQQQQNRYPSGTQQDFLLSSDFTAPNLSGGLDPNWRDNVLSAPSTMAPSPPVPTLDTDKISGGGDTSLVGVPGSARALARMIHFSNNNNNNNNTSNHAASSIVDSLGQRGDATTVAAAPSLSISPSSGSNAAAAEVGGGGGVDPSTASPTGVVGGGDGGCAKAIGSWMISPDVYDQGKPGAAAGEPKEEGYVNEDGTEQLSLPGMPVVHETGLSGKLDSTETAGGWVSESGTTGPRAISEEQDEHDFFVMEPSEEHRGGGALAPPLPGIWRVFQSQGYPYYLHEASGHSQWEDPRGREGPLPRDLSTMMVATDATAEVGAGSDSRSEAKGMAVVYEGQERIKDASPTAEGEDWERPPLASPITPTGVPVAVKVSQFVDAAVVPRTHEVSADYYGAAASGYGEGGERESGKGADVDVMDESAGREGLGGASGGSNDGYGSTDSHNFSSIDTSGLLMKSYSSGSDCCAPSLPNNTDDVAVSSEDENNSSEGCHHDFENNVAGGGSHMSRGDSTGWDATRKSERKDIDNRIEAEVDDDDRCSLLADRVESAVSDGVQYVDVRSPDASVQDKASVVGVGGHDRTKVGSNSREEDEHDEHWWQELDDETGGGRDEP